LRTLNKRNSFCNEEKTCEIMTKHFFKKSLKMVLSKTKKPVIDLTREHHVGEYNIWGFNKINYHDLFNEIFFWKFQ